MCLSVIYRSMLLPTEPLWFFWERGNTTLPKEISRIKVMTQPKKTFFTYKKLKYGGATFWLPSQAPTLSTLEGFSYVAAITE